MALIDRELQNINSSGELTELFLSAIADGNEVLIKQAIEALLSTHTSNISNPHQVSKPQLDIGNVDNTSDVDKPVSTAQQSYVEGKFGNFSFEGLQMLIQGKLFLSSSGDRNILHSQNGDDLIYFDDDAKQILIQQVDGNQTSYITVQPDVLDIVVRSDSSTYQFIRLTDTSLLFPQLTIEIIDASSGTSAVTKDWTFEKFFAKSAYIDTFTGTPNQPILTDVTGKIDSTLISISVGELQGNFTPTGGTEYPTLTDHVPSDYWVVDGVAEPSGYTFATGDLSGQTCYNGAWMQLDTNLNWVLANNYEGASTTWGAILGTLSAQTDLQNALNLKADQTSLDTTNSNISSNTTEIGNNSTAIGSNTTAIGTKADQTALDTTNGRVTTNEADILALQGKVATDPGNSSATSMGQLVNDYNTLLANLRASGQIA